MMRTSVLLIALAMLGGCATGPKITATPYPACSGPNGCSYSVEKGGWLKPYMGVIVDQRMGPNGQRMMMPMTNASGPSLLQTTLPVAISAWGGWQAAALQAGAIKWAASHQRGQQFIIQGGDAQALQHTEVDVVQNPGDLDANIEETHLYPAPPGN
jgi:hypothetical protein